jgi:hypothetical protein
MSRLNTYRIVGLLVVAAVAHQLGRGWETAVDAVVLILWINHIETRLDALEARLGANS